MAKNDVAEGWTAFVGGTLFEIGGYMMILEALNRKHEVRRQKFNINGRSALETRFTMPGHVALTISTIVVQPTLNHPQKATSKVGGGSVRDGGKSDSLQVPFNSVQRPCFGYPP
jgi:hypothetical protein